MAAVLPSHQTSADALRREGDSMSTLPAEPPAEEESIDEVEAALAWPGGDARAAIATLLDDCRHLRLQLVLTEAAMSRGFTRGWKPSSERTEA